MATRFCYIYLMDIYLKMCLTYKMAAWIHSITSSSSISTGALITAKEVNTKSTTERKHGIIHHEKLIWPLFVIIRYPAEIHVVHYNDKYGDFSEASHHADGLAVLGILVEVSHGG